MTPFRNLTEPKGDTMTDPTGAHVCTPTPTCENRPCPLDDAIGSDPFPWETAVDTEPRESAPPVEDGDPGGPIEVEVDPEIAAAYDVPPDQLDTIDPDARDLVTPDDAHGPAGEIEITPRIVRDLLLLVGYDLDLHEIVEGWDQAILAEVAAYAAAVHVHASDHDDVGIPAVPAVLAGRPVWGKVDPADPVAPADDYVDASTPPTPEQVAAGVGSDGHPTGEPPPDPVREVPAWEGLDAHGAEGVTITGGPPRISDGSPGSPAGFRGGKVPPPHDRIELSSAVLDLRAVDQLLDQLAEPVELARTTANMRDTVLDVVRTRASLRQDARIDAVRDGEKVTETTLRREAVGAADDSDALAALAGVFAAGATEAKQIAGELLDELPKRGGKPRASMRVGDGHGFELSIVRSKRSELSVAHDEIDDVLTAALVAAAEGTDTLALGVMPVKTYAAGIRDGVAGLRRLLASNPTYRSTALDSMLKDLQNLADDSLAKRLDAAYGKVDKGEPTVKFERKPLAPADDDEEAGS